MEYRPKPGVCDHLGATRYWPETKCPRVPLSLASSTGPLPRVLSCTATIDKRRGQAYAQVYWFLKTFASRFYTELLSIPCFHSRKELAFTALEDLNGAVLTWLLIWSPIHQCEETVISGISVHGFPWRPPTLIFSLGSSEAPLLPQPPCMWFPCSSLSAQPGGCALLPNQPTSQSLGLKETYFKKPENAVWSPSCLWTKNHSHLKDANGDD